jgi:hypothetical protein
MTLRIDQREQTVTNKKQPSKIQESFIHTKSSRLERCPVGFKCRPINSPWKDRQQFPPTVNVAPELKALGDKERRSNQIFHALP